MKRIIIPILSVIAFITGEQIALAASDNHVQYDKLTSDVRKQPRSRGNEYRPLLEQGKTWKYSLVDWTTIFFPTFNPENQTEHLRETRLEGYETIEGETYMKLVVYYDGSDTPAEENPLYYLREDTETGRIYFYPHVWISPDEGELFYDGISWEAGHNQQWIYDEWCLGSPGLLYDFAATDGHNFSVYETTDESYVILPDGEHRCLLVSRGSANVGSVIEGIGLTSEEIDCGVRAGSSILGISMSGRLSYPDSYYDSYLYEVVNGDGEVIYTNDSYRPGWWQGEVSLTDIMTEARVSVTTDGIAITGAPDAEAGLYDMQGRLLSGGHTRNGCLTISTSGMPAGVYVLRIGSQTHKVAIR